MTNQIVGSAPIELFDLADSSASFLRLGGTRRQRVDASEVLVWCHERDIAMDLTTSKHGGRKLYRIKLTSDQMFEFKMRWWA